MVIAGSYLSPSPNHKPNKYGGIGTFLSSNSTPFRQPLATCLKLLFDDRYSLIVTLATLFGSNLFLPQ